jgi:hypothetical protein
VARVICRVVQHDALSYSFNFASGHVTIACHPCDCSLQCRVAYSCAISSNLSCFALVGIRDAIGV